MAYVVVAFQLQASLPPAVGGGNGKFHASAALAPARKVRYVSGSLNWLQSLFLRYE
jgi:hypothetical protein